MLQLLKNNKVHLKSGLYGYFGMKKMTNQDKEVFDSLQNPNLLGNLQELQLVNTAIHRIVKIINRTDSSCQNS